MGNLISQIASFIAISSVQAYEFTFVNQTNEKATVNATFSPDEKSSITVSAGKSGAFNKGCLINYSISGANSYTPKSMSRVCNDKTFTIKYVNSKNPKQGIVVE